MSAFMVSDNTINRILSQITVDDAGRCLGRFAELSIVELGEKMLKMNEEALFQRYGDKAPVEKIKLKTTDTQCSKIQALKSLRCLLYQCSEGKVPETVLFKSLEKLSDRWALSIINDLDDYANAEWD